MFFSGFGTDDENELPGSTDWFKLDGEVGLGRANKRADLVKVESLLANSGDLDLSEIGGPTGYGLYTVEDGVKKYQSRNGLDVDGWMRPGGPTISKMKEQLGGLLSGYPAPTPEQVDQHHRLRAQGKDGLLNVDLPPISLKGNPYLPAVDKTTHGSNESWVNWMTRHQKGLGGAPEMLATYIKNFGTDGVVQARDFVEQWEKAMPGEGATAIRAVLSRLSDPAQQRAFLGGELPKGTPFGVLKPEAADATSAQDWVYDFASKTAYLRGTQPGEKSGIRDMAYRPNDPENQPGWEYDPVTGERIWVDPNKPRPPRLPKPGDEEGKPFWGYDRITGKRIWIDPRQPMSLDAARNGDSAAADERDEREFDHGLLASAVEASKKGVQVASNETSMSDAVVDGIDKDAEAQPREPSSEQMAQAQSPNPAHIDAYFDKLDKSVRELAERLEIDPTYLHTLFGYESGWMKGTDPQKNNPTGASSNENPRSYNSIEEALAKWEANWGEIVKGSKSMDEFIDRLQKRDDVPGEPKRYNTVRSRQVGKPNERGKFYEDDLQDMHRTILNRYPNWPQNRRPSG